ncbi:MAG: ABC transporter permease [Candidatus Caldarchaeum sp.]|uniref:ABC transporter permease n=1 Tax=Caldiarchaeum subterraneum TaxID=311458 RepID=A0A7C5LFE3_CALS0
MSIATLVRKELRELLMEKTIIIGVVLMPLVILPLIGGTIAMASRSATTSTADIPILLVDNEGGKYSKVLSEAFRAAGFSPITVTNTSESVASLMESYRVAATVYVEKGFSQNLTDGKRASVKMFTTVSSISIAELQKISSIRSRIYLAMEMLGERLAAETGIHFSFYKQPVELKSGLLYKGRQVSLEEAGTVFQLYMATMVFVPLVLVVMVATSGTVAATSIGLEKEAKTLEMLLTLPISRTSILTAKLVASMTVALMGTASMVFGFVIYLTNLPMVELTSTELTMPLSGFTLLLLGLVMFVALVMTLCIGILAGVLAGDVRGGQQLAGLLQMPLLLLPFLILQFADINGLPPTLSAALMLSPFTHMFLAIKSIYEEAYLMSVLHLVVMTAFLMVILVVASWFFKGERLLTMRVTLRRRRG